MEAKALEAAELIPLSSSKEEALENAIAATEMYMKALKLASTGSERERLKSDCMEILARAEEIKQLNRWDIPFKQKRPAEMGLGLSAPVSKRVLSTCEQVILREGSNLHGYVFPLWTSEPDEELFQAVQNNELFLDSSELKLSKSQQKYFAGWRRPYEAFRLAGNMPEAVNEPNMIATSNIDLVQDVTADCSVVASLCAAAARKGCGFEKLLCTVFYPFDRERNRPMISESGRYIFRFEFNGCSRQVAIDDRLPYSDSLRTLHVIDRQNPGLLWPALLEKAYLKVQGGYDFPGSNSGTDLWILTGWIPEQVFLQSDELDPQRLWNRLLKSHGFGDVMLSLGTGRLGRLEEERLGLAGKHDYAVLDMKEADGQQLMLVKNPWCNGTVWRGVQPVGISHKNPLNINTDDDGAQRAQKSESSPGTFWIAFSQVLCNFEFMYVNWNPGLFRFRQDHHFNWTIRNSVSPACLTHNPQYSVSSMKGGPVWILLSRHFSTQVHDSLSSSAYRNGNCGRSSPGFMSLYICDTNGRRVHLSDTMIRNPFVDSPQTLVCLDMPAMTCYTIVIAQQDLPLSRHSFTLCAYSRDPLNIDHALEIYPYHKLLTSAWTLRTGGGNVSSPSYTSNPQFQIFVTSTTDMVLLLETDQPELPVHVKIVWGRGERVNTITARDILGESGEYRRGFALTEVSNVLPGIYTIICSTFEQGQMGSFALRVESTTQCEVRPIAGEATGRLRVILPRAVMYHGVDRMLAPVVVSRLTTVKAIARHCNVFAPSLGAKAPLKVSLEQGQGPNKVILASSCDGEFSVAPTGVRTDDVDVSPQNEALWLVVERFEGSKSIDEIEVEILSEAPIEVGIWGTGSG